jgi:diaminopimelate epimerase
VAAALANPHRKDLRVGRRFWKMSGSGNDFVVFDSRGAQSDGAWERPDAIQTLCAHGTGVGADGVVFLAEARRAGAAIAMRYYNSDGSRGAFCGNATLCVTRLARELEVSKQGEMIMLETDSGLVPARMGDSGPEIVLPAVSESSLDVPGLSVRSGERRIGFALAGVPHLVVRCDDVASVPVTERGRELRHSEFRSGGANVNFVSERNGAWSIRTFERGVEGETLACGSGAIASAILLSRWKESEDTTALTTRSGRVLTVRLEREGESWKPTLAGEGRLVFTGELAEWAS